MYKMTENDLRGKKMKFIKGRHNLSVTCYVPTDCLNNCSFCTSKKEYQKNTNIEKIKEQLRKVRDSSIKEVVFTGGEPMLTGRVLSELMDIVQNKTIYINTNFIQKDIAKFIHFFNNVSCLKGINISRHSTEFKYEKLKDIATDDYISLLTCPVKINVVIPEEREAGFFRKVLSRWQHSNFEVCFRSDFTKTNMSNLHTLDDPILMELLSIGEFIDHKYCEVCDTTIMYSNEFRVKYIYHRGLETTSIKFGNTIQVNDIIIFPDGTLSYDWDRKSKWLKEFETSILKKEVCLQSSYSYGHGCGSSGCGSGGC